MYFALLCCPLLMTNVLHLPSGPIVSQTECHNVVKFFQPKIHGCFSVSFPSVSQVCHFVISSHRNNTSLVRKITHQPSPLVICWSYAVVAYIVWWFYQHIIYLLSIHAIVSFSSFPSMLVGFF